MVPSFARGCVLAAVVVAMILSVSNDRVVSAEEFFIPVRSIDEVTVGAMPEIRDVTAAEAVLVFESSVPLACSVVYGDSPDFGRIATDLDMNGGAHSDHHPMLTGLRPNTEYFFRVQGTASDGTIYVGGVETFRTPRQVAAAPANLATLQSGARITNVSSNFGGAANHDSWGADNAIDGSRNTAWSSFGDGNDAFIEIEFADRAEVDEVEVWTRSMSDGTARILVFTLTTDGGDVLGPFDLPDAGQPHRFDVDVVTRSFRLDVVESSGGNVGLIEFGAFGRK